MKRSRDHSYIEFGGPATYLIVVQGALSPEWSERLAGLEITTTHEGAAPQTNLRGRLHDQAELNGVLDTLYNMHLSILNVKRVDDEP